MNTIKKRIFAIFIFQIFYFISLVSAAHYIVGEVNNALDSTSANDKIIVVWNPANGINDNLTDIVGQNGNSGVDNTYFLDCEMLSSPCTIGDTINAKIFNISDQYLTSTASTLVTGSGYDLMSSLTLNSPPSVIQSQPINYLNWSSSTISLFCNATDLDSDLSNLTLYGNWTGTWSPNETKSITGYSNNTSFSPTLSDGRYNWSCLVRDSLNTFSFAPSNKTFTIDTTPPNISAFYTNSSDNFYGYLYQTRVTCNVTDSLTGIRNVTLRVTSPLGMNTSYNTQLANTISHYADINVNSTGQWNFSCISYDYTNNLNTRNITINATDAVADLEILSQNISFVSSFIESSTSQIVGVISNRGGVNADNVLIGTFLGPRETGSQIGPNRTFSIPAFSNITFNMTWTPEIGFNDIYIYVDINSSITESNETNNHANRIATILAWQNFYGNLSVGKILGVTSSRNISAWSNNSNTTGNIFVVDRESTINWFSLKPIGKDSLDQNTSNDFADIDTLLNMTGLEDSMVRVYTNSTNVNYSTDTFTIFKQTINQVPIVRSTNSSNFETGILWDTTKDTDSEFDITNKEDLVFVTKVNQNSQGAYGIYDYEIRVPAKLRNYYDTDSSKVDFYYDLV